MNSVQQLAVSGQPKAKSHKLNTEIEKYRKMPVRLVGWNTVHAQVLAQAVVKGKASEAAKVTKVAEAPKVAEVQKRVTA